MARACGHRRRRTSSSFIVGSRSSTWGSVPPPLTWRHGVEMLAPGTWRIRRIDGREAHGVFADTRDAYRSDRRHPLSEAALRAVVGDAVRDSVRAHLIADVPVGVFL